MSFEFIPWAAFEAYHDRKAIRKYLKDVADKSEETFVRRIKSGPKTGRMYGSHQASAPGEYPANRTGTLAGSVGSRSSDTEAEVGSNAPYSGYLRDGTRRMARRRMSDDALKETMDTMRGKLKFARFRHV